jgi:hypothetical protein
VSRRERVRLWGDDVGCPDLVSTVVSLNPRISMSLVACPAPEIVLRARLSFLKERSVSDSFPVKPLGHPASRGVAVDVIIECVAGVDIGKASSPRQLGPRDRRAREASGGDEEVPDVRR